jgi:hypothetical protein
MIKIMMMSGYQYQKLRAFSRYNEPIWFRAILRMKVIMAKHLMKIWG